MAARHGGPPFGRHGGARFTREFTAATLDSRVQPAVPDEMQQPFDAAAKALIDAALVGVCEVTLQAPTTTDTLYIDALVTPTASEAALLARGLLGRMALSACAIEAFVDTPGPFDVDHCFARALFLGAKRRVSHRLWVIAPGAPRTAIEAWALRMRRGWPRGVYMAAAPARLAVVVLSQLPRTPDTLLLRLMGSGSLLREAVSDARALPASSWERAIVDDVLLQMKRDLDRMMRTATAPTEELQMRYAELVKINAAERAAFRAEVIEEGRAEGRAAEHVAGLRAAIVDLCDVLGVAVSEARRAELDRMDAAQLDRVRLALKHERRWPE
jgi:hypothetical protein